MRDVYIIGVGMTRFGKHLEKTEKDLTAEAVNMSLTDAGVQTDDIQTAWLANTM